MKFWFSGELDHRIGDAYRPIRARVEVKLNRMCEGPDYGDAVTKIAITPMIRICRAAAKLFTVGCGNEIRYASFVDHE